MDSASHSEHDHDIEIDTAQSCFDESMWALSEIGLEPTFSTDMMSWVSTIDIAPGRTIINPTFDPRESDVSPDNCFWIRLDERETGRPISVIANRVFETDDYMDLMRNQYLWFRDGPRHPPVNVITSPDMPLIRGRVGHHGGLWIHPEWRKHGLSGFMTRLARCGSLRQFNIDWHCGLVFAAVAEKGLPVSPTMGYGYPRMALAIDGWQPLTNKHDRLYVPWISRTEIIAHLVEETGRLVANRNKQPRGLAVAF